MATTEEIAALQAEIADLETSINAGATSVTQDGQNVTIDLEHQKKRLRDLRDKLARCQTENGTPTRPDRPRVRKIDLS